MTFEEWWKSYNLPTDGTYAHSYSMAKMAWDARQAEVDRLQGQVVEVRRDLRLIIQKAIESSNEIVRAAQDGLVATLPPDHADEKAKGDSQPPKPRDERYQLSIGKDASDGK